MSHNVEEYTPLFAAAARGDLKSVKAAVAKDKAILSVREWDDATLLHNAIEKRQLRVAKYLLEQGADANSPAKGGVSPLHIAAQNGDIQSIKLLVQHGANLEVLDSRGRTPAERARQWKQVGAIKLLEKLRHD